MQNEEIKLVKIDDDWNNTGAELFHYTYIRTEDGKRYAPVTSIYLHQKGQIILVESLTAQDDEGRPPALPKKEAKRQANLLHSEIASAMIENTDDFKEAVQTIYDSYLAGQQNDQPNEQPNLS
jgi:hypothetical protein